jgi:hypothetical protein
MNNQFDELTKGLAQSTTRRGALKKFGLALPGIALAMLGLANKAQANPQCQPSGRRCRHDHQCCSGYCYHDFENNKNNGYCF